MPSSSIKGRTLSYRALDVENIGYVYEGLLEKTVQRAKPSPSSLPLPKALRKRGRACEEIEAATADGSLEALLKGPHRQWWQQSTK